MTYRTITHDFEDEDDAGEPITYTVTICASPGRSGYIGGPPEDCYPDEPGDLEIMSITLGGLPLESLNFTPEEIERIEERIEERAWDLPESVLFGEDDFEPEDCHDC
jgi:hypothetical protein